MQDNIPLTLGLTRGSLTTGSFNGLLDNIRIDGRVIPLATLEADRVAALGDAAPSVANPGNGGGLHITGPGVVTIVGGTVSGNAAAAEGGGLWNSTTGHLTVTGSRIEGNVASGNDPDQGGGGIYNDGGTLAVTNTTLSGNKADGTSGSGGGVLSVAGSVTLTDSSLEFNGAKRAGGGIEIVNGSLTLTQSNLINNDVTGTVTGGSPSPGNGGGLHVSGIATTLIDGGVISGNVAANEGGGLWNQGGSTLTIRNGTLIQVNRALGNAASQGGGGIFNNGGTVNINDASIVSNFADGTSGSGGGLFNASGGTMYVTDTLIAQNVASRAGGGIEDASVTSGSATGNSITLTRVDLMQNNAGVIIPSSRGGALFSSPGNGGGLHITGAANVVIVDTNVVGNIAANEGGGLWNSTGVLAVVGSTLSGNSAPDGGGIFNDSPAGDVRLTNSTLSSNGAARGGAIRSEGGNVSLTSVTIALNTATTQGGGLDVVAGSASISSSIIGTNTAPAGPDINGAVTSGGFNVIGNTSGATIGSTNASDRLNVNPQLSALANNGGRTQTHSLRSNSPALGNGNPSGVNVDQRGTARPQGGAVDSGAFESNLPTSSPAASDRIYDVNGDGIISPRDALIVINYINRSRTEGEAASSKDSRSPAAATDVNGDGVVSPIDALLVINFINRNRSGATSPASDLVFAEPAASQESVVDQRKRQIDDLLLDQLASDVIRLRG